MRSLQPLPNQLVLIPAAGFGRRMGSPPAKELLIPLGRSRNFIDQALYLCRHWQTQALVVLRKDKYELQQHLQATTSPDWVRILAIENSKEWADTCLQAIPELVERNLLLLPDTEFEPQGLGAEMLAAVDSEPSRQLILATFSPPNLSSWGCWQRHPEKSDRSQIAEKPSQAAHPAEAWGLVAFHRQVARPLFTAIQTSHETQGEWQDLPVKPTIRTLEKFEDLTRG